MIDLSNTLEELDHQIENNQSHESSLVKTCQQLRKKQLKDFTIEDLRIMIGQSFNLEILIPLAVPKLQENILAESNFYEGDLLKTVLDCDEFFWKKNKELWSIVRDLYISNKATFEADSRFRQIKKSFENFEKI